MIAEDAFEPNAFVTELLKTFTVVVCWDEISFHVSVTVVVLGFAVHEPSVQEVTVTFDSLSGHVVV
ncbi:hypothetical protein JHU04_004627 [Brenneria sp. 4F2]|nr:hypothetical protein [Brenneria bubanii]